jgi:hypothetical protein
MLGKVSAQLSMEQADAQYLSFVGPDTFYGRVAQFRHRLFRDADFADLYCANNGRPSVPPSLLATALLLAAHDKTSDEETEAHAAFDLRWKVALGTAIDERPFVKSTLQLFRSQLVVNKKVGAIFQASLEEAKRQGFLKGKKMTLAIDTTPILGKGAVQDTYNLLGTGIVQLVRQLAVVADAEPEQWARDHDLSRYFGTSLKGEAAIEWDDKEQREALLASIVGDAKRLLAIARQVRSGLAPESHAAQEISQAADLLCQLLAQDIEEDHNGTPKLRDGVAPDRIPSATDPEMRHGRKSSSKRFDGYKASVAVDAETGVVTAADVIPGNAPDNQGALDLVASTEHSSECQVDKTIGDCAYGDGATRQQFAQAQRNLVAKVPRRPQQLYPKDRFDIDLHASCVTCPAGHTVNFPRPYHECRDKGCKVTFPVALCAGCPLRPQCMKEGARGGRTLTIHPQEDLLQQARAYQATDAFRQDIRARQTVEHRIARLIQLGVRQSRYFGRAKTLFQLLMAAAVANLTLAWNQVTQDAPEGGTQRGLYLASVRPPQALQRAFRGLWRALTVRSDCPSHPVAAVPAAV